MAHDLHDDDFADGYEEVGLGHDGHTLPNVGYNDGHSDGYDAGHTAGYKAGYEAGLEAGREEKEEGE